MILDVNRVFIQWVPTIDEDGGTKVNRDGSEAGKNCLVIVGNDYPVDPELSGIETEGSR